MQIGDISTALKRVLVEAIETGAATPFAETGVSMPREEIWERYARAAYDAARQPITTSQLAAFKQAFYNNTGDETDDPFVKAFEAIGFAVSSTEPPTS